LNLRDKDKTKEQVLKELSALRQLVLNIERSKLNDLALYRTLFETSPESIGVFDLDGKLLYANASAFKMFGYEQVPEVHGKDITEFCIPEQRRRKLDQVKLVLENDVILRDEYVGLRKDGTTFESVEMDVLVRDKSGTARFILSYARDITELKRAEQKARIKAKELEEANAALKVLLKQIQEGKSDIEQRILSNIRELVLPYVDNLRHAKLSTHQAAIMDVIEANLKEISSTFLQHLKLNYYDLTPREIEVANLVREGRSIKEIAALLRVTIRTVESHRKSLREKMGLKNRKTNLRTHLLSLQ